MANSAIWRILAVTMQPYAECTEENCRWTRPASEATRGQAKSHVRTSGHRVRIVVEQVSIWGPK